MMEWWSDEMIKWWSDKNEEVSTCFNIPILLYSNIPRPARTLK